MAEHGPFDVQQILGRMSAGVCDPVTVYRCLETFEHARLVRRCDFSDGVVRYELIGDDHHHHLICRSCGKVEELEIDVHHLHSLERAAETRGYAGVAHSLEFFGICPDCQRSRRRT